MHPVGGCSRKLALRPQSARSFLQVPEILGAGHLGHLARTLRLVHLDPQLLHLPLQALLASLNLARPSLRLASASASVRWSADSRCCPSSFVLVMVERHCAERSSFVAPLSGCYA